MRVQSQMNIPGRLYEFKVQIFDQNRTSNWASCFVLIQPQDSLNKDCLQLELTMKNLTTNFSSNFKYPLINYLAFNTYCPDITYDKYEYSYSLTQDSAISVIPYTLTNLQVFKNGPQSDYIVYPLMQKGLLFQNPTQFSISYSITYNIFGLYQSNTKHYQLITFQSEPNMRNESYFIFGPTIINLEREILFTLIVKARDHKMINPFVRWTCDPLLQIQSLCNITKNSSLNIRITDIKQQVLLDLYQRPQTLKFTALINNQMANFNVYLTDSQNHDQIKKTSQCRIKHSQQALPNIQTLTTMRLWLKCLQNIDLAIFTFEWTLNDVSTNQFIKMSNERHFILAAMTLEQNHMYLVNLVMKTSYDKSIFNYSLDLNTTFPAFSTFKYPPRLQPYLNVTSQNLSSRYFYETPFNISLNRNLKSYQSSSNQELNLYYSVRIQGNDQRWFNLVPMTYGNISFMIIPEYKKLIVDVYNNYGYRVSQDETDQFDIYRHQETSDIEILKSLRDLLSQINIDDNLYETQNAIYSYLTLLEKQDVTIQRGNFQNFTKILVQSLNATFSRIFLDYNQSLNECQLTNDTCIQLYQNSQSLLIKFVDMLNTSQSLVSLSDTYLFYSTLNTSLTFDEEFLFQAFTNDVNGDMLENYLEMINQIEIWGKRFSRNQFSYDQTKIQRVTFRYNGYLQILQDQENTISLSDYSFDDNITMEISNRVTVEFSKSAFVISNNDTKIPEYLSASIFKQQQKRRLLDEEISIAEFKVYDPTYSQMSDLQLRDFLNITFKNLIGLNFTCAHMNLGEIGWSKMNETSLQTHYQGDNEILCSTQQIYDRITLVDFNYTKPQQIQKPTFIVFDVTNICEKEWDTFYIVSVVSILVLTFMLIIAKLKDKHQISTNKILKKFTLLQTESFYKSTLTRLEETIVNNQSQHSSKCSIFIKILCFKNSFFNLWINLPSVPIYPRYQILIQELLLMVLTFTLYQLVIPESFPNVHILNFQNNFYASLIVGSIVTSILYLPLELYENFTYWLHLKVEGSQQNAVHSEPSIHNEVLRTVEIPQTTSRKLSDEIYDKQRERSCSIDEQGNVPIERVLSKMKDFTDNGHSYHKKQKNNNPSKNLIQLQQIGASFEKRQRTEPETAELKLCKNAPHCALNDTRYRLAKTEHKLFSENIDETFMPQDLTPNKDESKAKIHQKYLNKSELPQKFLRGMSQLSDRDDIEESKDDQQTISQEENQRDDYLAMSDIKIHPSRLFSMDNSHQSRSQFKVINPFEQSDSEAVKESIDISATRDISLGPIGEFSRNKSLFNQGKNTLEIYIPEDEETKINEKKVINNPESTLQTQQTPKTESGMINSRFKQNIPIVKSQIAMRARLISNSNNPIKLMNFDNLQEKTIEQPPGEQSSLSIEEIHLENLNHNSMDRETNTQQNKIEIGYESFDSSKGKSRGSKESHQNFQPKLDQMFMQSLRTTQRNKFTNFGNMILSFFGTLLDYGLLGYSLYLWQLQLTESNCKNKAFLFDRVTNLLVCISSSVLSFVFFTILTSTYLCFTTNSSRHTCMQYILLGGSTRFQILSEMLTSKVERDISVHKNFDFHKSQAISNRGLMSTDHPQQTSQTLRLKRLQDFNDKVNNDEKN